MAIFLFSNISAWYTGFSLAYWHILRTCRWTIPLQERPRHLQHRSSRLSRKTPLRCSDRQQIAQRILSLYCRMCTNGKALEPSSFRAMSPNLSRSWLSECTQRFLPRQTLQLCRRLGSFQGLWLPTWQHIFQWHHSSGHRTQGSQASVTISTLLPWKCFKRLTTAGSRCTWPAKWLPGSVAGPSSVMVRWLAPLPLTLVVMPLLPILVQQHQWQYYPRRVCRRHQCLRMRTAQNWSFQMVKVAPAWATSECFQTRRSFATHISTLRGLWTLQCICYHSDCHGRFAMPSFAEFLNFQIAGVWYHTWYHGPESMILSMISWVYGIISSWYHRSRIMIS